MITEKEIGAGQSIHLGEDKMIDVTAIVSTYNSEKYIEGCLDDLEDQSIKDNLEIIVIDSGSQENEKEIVQKWQRNYHNIRYFRTEFQTIYSAWNQAIKTAQGRYLTSANTDDRHVFYAYERMRDTLDERKDIALVYADCWITEEDNQTFEKINLKGVFAWKDFSLEQLKKGCFMGPQPMWRKELHDKYGYFDESFTVAGDWEFWLRMASCGTQFLHLHEVLGIYQKRRDSLERKNTMISSSESEIVRKKYMEES